MRGLCDTTRTFRDSSRRFGESIHKPIAKLSHPSEIAKLFPIHKNGLKHDPSNYRPVSILPVISKVIERHITKHLFGFLIKFKLLHKAQ